MLKKEGIKGPGVRQSLAQLSIRLRNYPFGKHLDPSTTTPSKPRRWRSGHRSCPFANLYALSQGV
jgi:hypothetical protein